MQTSLCHSLARTPSQELYFFVPWLRPMQTRYDYLDARTRGYAQRSNKVSFAVEHVLQSEESRERERENRERVCSFCGSSVCLVTLCVVSFSLRCVFFVLFWFVLLVFDYFSFLLSFFLSF